MSRKKRINTKYSAEFKISVIMDMRDKLFGNEFGIAPDSFLLV